jgi:hypothetical protein
LKISPRKGGKVLKNLTPEGGKVLKKSSGKGPYVLRTDKTGTPVLLRLFLGLPSTTATGRLRERRRIRNRP